MVEKISVNVKIISLNLEHNFLVPLEMNVGDATTLIVKALLEEYPGAKQNRVQNTALMQLSTGKLLPAGCSLKQLGIIQGEKLLLI